MAVSLAAFVHAGACGKGKEGIRSSSGAPSIGCLTGRRRAKRRSGGCAVLLGESARAYCWAVLMGGGLGPSPGETVETTLPGKR
eukprot:3511703-Pyramimonas_sp.AAC.1